MCFLFPHIWPPSKTCSPTIFAGQSTKRFIKCIEVVLPCVLCKRAPFATRVSLTNTHLQRQSMLTCSHWTWISAIYPANNSVSGWIRSAIRGGVIQRDPAPQSGLASEGFIFDLPMLRIPSEKGPRRVKQHLSQWRQAIRCARGIGHHSVAGGVLGVVHAHDIDRDRVFGRCRDDHLLGALRTHCQAKPGGRGNNYHPGADLYINTSLN